MATKGYTTLPLMKMLINIHWPGHVIHLKLIHEHVPGWANCQLLCAKQLRPQDLIRQVSQFENISIAIRHYTTAEGTHCRDGDRDPGEIP